MLKECRMLNESKEEDLKDKAEEVSKNVKDQGSLIKFLKKNKNKVEEKASKMEEEEDRSVFLFIWNKLCYYVWRGTSFILSHIVEIMKLVVLIVLAFFGYKLYRKFTDENKEKEDIEEVNRRNIVASTELCQRKTEEIAERKAKLEDVLDLNGNNKNIERPKETINPQDGSPIQLSQKDRDRIVKYLNRDVSEHVIELDPIEKIVDSFWLASDATNDKSINTCKQSIEMQLKAGDWKLAEQALIGISDEPDCKRNLKCFDMLMERVIKWEKDPKSFQVQNERISTLEDKDINPISKALFFMTPQVAFLTVKAKPALNVFFDK